MRYKNITFRKKNHVVKIEIEKGVKYLTEIAPELSDLCSAIATDEDVYVVVLGIELKEQIAYEKKLGNLKTSGLSDSSKCYMAKAVADLNMPVICSINGYATGQILELALACDIRIASKTSHFGLTHIKAGMIPWDGGTQRLARIVGRSKALEMILTGDAVNSQEAYETGLVNQLFNEEDLQPAIADMAEKIASNGPIALKYIKEAIHRGMDMTMKQGLHLEADLYFLLHTSIDRTEGIKAFQEKRKTQFLGR